MLLLILSLTLSASIVSSQNCFQKQPTDLKTANIRFSENLLSLTSFVESSSEQFHAGAWNLITEGDPSFLIRSIIELKTNYLILLFGILFLVALMLLLRTNLTYSHKLIAFFSKDSIQASHPCTIIINLICLALILFFSFTMPNIYESLTKFDCSCTHLHEIMINGGGAGWDGINGAISSLSSKIQLLKVIEQMPNIFDSDTSSISRRASLLAPFLYDFENKFYNGSVRAHSDNDTVAYPSLVPQIFSVFKAKANQSLQTLLSISHQAVLVSQLLEESNSHAQIMRSNFENQIISLKMAKQRLEGNQFWEKFRFKEFIPHLSILDICMRIFSYACPQVIFLHLLFLLMLMKVRESLFAKCTNFVWVLILLFSVLTIAILFYLSLLNHLSSSFCHVLSGIESDSSRYQQLSANEELKALFYPCFYSDGIFGHLTGYEMRMGSLQFGMGNLTAYVQGQEQFQLSSTLVEVLDEMSFYIQEQQLNKENRWPYISELLLELKKQTRDNNSGEGCFDHIWVSSLSECSPLDRIVKEPHSQSLMHSSPSCLPLSWDEAFGKKHLISYSEFMSNYVSDRSRCPIAIARIEAIGLKLVNGLSIKFSSLQSMQLEVVNAKSRIFDLLQLLRKNLLLQKRHFAYLSTFASLEASRSRQIQFDEIVSLRANCSILKDRSQQVYSSICWELQPQLARTHLLTIIIAILMPILGVFGMIHGFNYEAHVMNDMQVLGRVGSGSLEKAVESNPYQHHFFY